MTTRRTTSTLALKAEIALLRQEVERLATERDQALQLVGASAAGDRPGTSVAGTIGDIAGNADDNIHDNIYVYDDDDAEAQAFDEFYRAYDEVHAKTRDFLLD